MLLMNPSEDAADISLKAGNMILNRFCIDETAAFELSGVYYLKQYSNEMAYKRSETNNSLEQKRKIKGKEFLTKVQNVISSRNTSRTFKSISSCR